MDIHTISWVFVDGSPLRSGNDILQSYWEALPSPFPEAIWDVVENFDEARCSCGVVIGFSLVDDDTHTSMGSAFTPFAVLAEDNKSWVICEDCAAALDPPEEEDAQ